MFCKVLQDQARCSAAKVGACLTLFLVLVPLTYDGQDQPQAELEVVTQHVQDIAELVRLDVAILLKAHAACDSSSMWPRSGIT